MLKIAVITRYFPSSAEPWQGRSAYQILRLLSRKADVHVFFPNANYPPLLKPPSRLYDRLDPSYSVPDVKVSYYDYPALPFISRPFNAWMAAHALLPHIRKFSPDIIHSFFLYPEGYAALKIGKALGIPVVAKGIGTDINRICGDIAAAPRVGYLSGRFSAMHTRNLVRNVDYLFTVSDDLRRKAITLGAHPERTLTVLNGCDLSIFHPRNRAEARLKLGIDPTSQAIVYIGRMDVKKGLRELVEAAVSLRPQRANLHVYLIGVGPDKQLIESAIQANNAAGYIHALPGCAFDNVAVWMAAADLITLPSYMEGCPNVVLEALASGRPVVATNVGGIPEILCDECGRLVPPCDAGALAQALASVLDRTWDAEVISAHGSRSWETVASELLKVFESLVNARAKGGE
jgi:glycosyltransferase involved in cell wall biosynthesis